MRNAHRPFCLFFLAVTALAACPAAAEPKVVQGFEVHKTWRVVGQRAAVLSAGEGVTEGAHALELPGGATLQTGVDGAMLPGMAWLKIDTLTVQPVVQPLVLELKGAEFEAKVHAYVQPGKDVLALPLSVLAARAGAALPEGKPMSLLVENPSAASLILDNIRLAPAAVPPQGAELVDFGPGQWNVWPGFSPGGQVHPRTRWSGQLTIYERSLAWPDPLTRDFVGPYPSHARSDSVKLTPPSPGPHVAWLWITHYGYRFTQPIEYAVKTPRKLLAQGRLTPRQLLSKDGLLMGLDEPWTPQWFSETYAPRFYKRVTVDVPSDGVVLTMGNAQLAAMAIAPSASHRELSEYVDAVSKDLVRYRRQFVVGARDKAVCTVPPTDEEAQAGAMLFAPAASRALAMDFSPKAEDRVQSLKIVAATGERVVVPLAAVPLRKASFTAAALLAMRSESGRTLTIGGERSEAFFLRRVPVVREARVSMRPWLLARRGGLLEPGAIAPVALVLQMPQSAEPGVYTGRLRVSFSSGRAEVPIEIELHDLGPAAPRPGMVLLGSSTVADALLGLYPSLPQATREAQEGAIRRQLAELSFDALTVDAPRLSSETAVRSAGLISDLRTWPAEDVWPVLSLNYTLRDLKNLSLAPGTVGFDRGVRSAVSNSLQVLAQKRIENAWFYVGYVNQAKDWREATFAAQSVRNAGGKAAVLATAGALDALAGKNWPETLKPFHALICTEGANTRKRIEEFRKLGGERVAYTYTSRPDRHHLGFYPWAVGGDGAVLRYAFDPDGPPHQGFTFSGIGLLTPEADGYFSRTLGALNVLLGASDAALPRRAEALRKQASDAQIPTADLDNVLLLLRAAGPSVSAEQGEKLRVQLIRAAGKLSAELKERK